jgi:hypothetical protein
MRIPRGLWADLEETVIQQDRQFLSEVARSLGLPVPEVLRKCLGTGGTSTPCPVLWAPTTFLEGGEEVRPTCPWWECHGGSLWRPCPRIRLSPSLPCAIHERCVPCPLTRLGNDPELVSLPRMLPATKGEGEPLYWYDPAEVLPTLSEDGRPVEGRRLVRITAPDGSSVLTWSPKG